MAPDVAYLTMLPGFLLGGIGMGLVFAPSSTAVLARMTDADNAKASGTNATVREVGVALGVAALSAVFTATGGLFTPTGFVVGATPAVLVGSAALGLATLLALLLPVGRPSAAPAPAPAGEPGSPGVLRSPGTAAATSATPG
jgi:hypothetical protein